MLSHDPSSPTWLCFSCSRLNICCSLPFFLTLCPPFFSHSYALLLPWGFSVILYFQRYSKLMWRREINSYIIPTRCCKCCESISIITEMENVTSDSHFLTLLFNATTIGLSDHLSFKLISQLIISHKMLHLFKKLILKNCCWQFLLNKPWCKCINIRVELTDMPAITQWLP